MKKIYLLIFILFVSLFCVPIYALALYTVPSIPAQTAVISNGATYYVNQDIGSNAYTKTQAQSAATPWDTIEYGLSQMVAGDTLIIKESASAYAGINYIWRVGTADAWFTIKGAPGERPVLIGLNLQAASRYISVENFRITPASNTGVYAMKGARYFNIENIDVVGGVYGLQFGTDIDEATGAKYGYVKNVNVSGTSNVGVLIENGAEDIVFDHVNVTDATGDGFSGRVSTTQTIGIITDLYFIDCTAYSNTGDGFDIGAGGTTIFKRCESYSNGPTQGVGVKVWGGLSDGDIWLINCHIYDNYQQGFAIKNFADANIYMIGNTFRANETGGGGLDVFVVNSSGADYMGIPSISMYDNLYYGGGTAPIFGIYNDDTVIVEADNNLYCADTDKHLFELRNDAEAIIQSYHISEIAATPGIWLLLNAIPASSERNSIFSNPYLDSRGRPGPRSPGNEAGTFAFDGQKYAGRYPAIGVYDYNNGITMPWNIALSISGGPTGLGGGGRTYILTYSGNYFLDGSTIFLDGSTYFVDGGL